MELRDTRFDDDLAVLVKALRKLLPARRVVQRALIGKLLIAIVAAAAAVAVFLIARPTKINLNGTWIAVMQKPGQRPYRVRFEFAQAADRLTGTVSYPTGDSAIRDGVITGSRLSFSTVHIPQFAAEPSTIRFDGEIAPGEIRLTSVDDNGVARGIARKELQ